MKSAPDELMNEKVYLQTLKTFLAKYFQRKFHNPFEKALRPKET